MGIAYFLAKNKPDKLVDLFTNNLDNEERYKIIQRLKELNAENELLNLLMRFQSMEALRVLLELRWSQASGLTKIYFMTQDNEVKNNIIQRLKELKAENELLYLLGKSEDRVILHALIGLFWNQSSRLASLYPMASQRADKEKIVKRLKEVQACDLLWQLDDPLALDLFLTGEYGFSEFYQRWNPISMILYKCNLFEYFFSRCSEKQRLFVLLMPCVRKISPLQLDIPVSDNFFANNYLRFPVFDAATLELKGLANEFDSIWNKYLSTGNPNHLRLASILDRRKLNKKLLDYDLCVYVESRKLEIENEYLIKRREANSKMEIESLLQEEDQALARVRSISLISSVYDKKVDMVYRRDEHLPVKQFWGNSISLNSLSEETFISDDVNIFVSKIRDELEETLISVREADVIMRAKTLAMSKISSVISTNDLAYSLANLMPESIGPVQLDLVLRKAFAEDKECLDRAILACFSRIKDKRELKFTLNQTRFHKMPFQLYEATRGMWSSANVELWVEFISRGADQPFFYASSPATKNDKALFSPDSKWLAVYEGVYSLNDMEYPSGKYIREALFFSPDSKWLVTQNSVLSVGDWKSVANLELPKGFSPDSKWLITESSVYSVGDWKIIEKVILPKCFSPDSKWLIACNSVYSVGDWEKVPSIDFSKILRQLVSVGSDFEGEIPSINWSNVEVREYYNQLMSSDFIWFHTSYGLFSTFNRYDPMLHLCVPLNDRVKGFSSDSQWFFTDRSLYSLGVCQKEFDCYYIRGFSSDSRWLNQGGLFHTGTWELVLNEKILAISPDSQWAVSDYGVYYIEPESLALKAILNSVIFLMNNPANADLAILLRVAEKLRGLPQCKALSLLLEHLITRVSDTSRNLSINQVNA